MVRGDVVQAVEFKPISNAGIGVVEVGLKPYYSEAGIEIYHGDCREILPSLPMVDLLATDPPYGIGFSEYESHKDDERSYLEFIRSCIFVAESRVVDGWAVVFQSAKRVRQWSETFNRPFRVIAYPKTFVQLLKVAGPTYATDYALAWPVGTPRTEKGLGRDYCVSQTGNTASNPKGHPCPRPLTQMRHVVETFSASPGATVLDPFMGSGTTLRAAKDAGRCAIGIEIEERYCEIAAKRLAQGVLFGIGGAA
jgi:site-specific DNA-methyltransferase (adenine-specific)